MTAMIDYLLALGMADPILVAILLGTVSAWATATLFEYFLAATTWDVNLIKREAILVALQRQRMSHVR